MLPFLLYHWKLLLIIYFIPCILSDDKCGQACDVNIFCETDPFCNVCTKGTCQNQGKCKSACRTDKDCISDICVSCSNGTCLSGRGLTCHLEDNDCAYPHHCIDNSKSRFITNLCGPGCTIKDPDYPHCIEFSYFFTLYYVIKNNTFFAKMIGRMEYGAGTPNYMAFLLGSNMNGDIIHGRAPEPDELWFTLHDYVANQVGIPPPPDFEKGGTDDILDSSGQTIPDGDDPRVIFTFSRYLDTGDICDVVIEKN